MRFECGPSFEEGSTEGASLMYHLLMSTELALPLARPGVLEPHLDDALFQTNFFGDVLEHLSTGV